jgi:hypothetical protein
MNNKTRTTRLSLKTIFVHALLVGCIFVSRSQAGNCVTATPGRATIKVQGQEQSAIDNSAPCPRCPLIRVYDSGHLNIVVGSYTASVPYGKPSTPATLAQALAVVFNNDATSPVSASAVAANLLLTTKATGPTASYPLNVTAATTDDSGLFTKPSFSGSPANSLLSGGTGVVPQNRSVFYVDLNGSVEELLFNGAGFTTQNLTALAVGPQAIPYSQVISVLDAFGQEHVFYLDQNNNINQLFFNNGSAGTPGWTNQTLTGAFGGPAPLRGTPLTGLLDGFSERIFYLDTTDNVNQLFFNFDNGTWTNQTLTGTTGSPSAFESSLNSFADGLGKHVFYMDQNAHVRQLLLNNAGWINQDLTALAGSSIAGGAFTTSFADGYGEHVFYLDQLGTLTQLFSSNNGWVSQNVAAAAGAPPPSAFSSLTSFTDTCGEHVVYLDGSNNVTHLSFSGVGWSNQNLTALSSGPSAGWCTLWMGSAWADASDDGEHMFYPDPIGDVNHLVRTNGNWTNQNLTSLAGSPPAATCPVLR